jgi:hypothetical protein
MRSEMHDSILLEISFNVFSPRMASTATRVLNSALYLFRCDLIFPPDYFYHSESTLFTCPVSGGNYNTQPQGIKAEFLQNLSRMRRIMHTHRITSMIVFVINVGGIFADESKCDAPSPYA